MKQISKYIKDIADNYYLDTENQAIYNSNTDEWSEPNKEHKVFIYTKSGRRKKYSMKSLYSQCKAGVYCIDCIENLSGEEWREIPNTQGNYLASSKGRIKSLKGLHATIMSGTKGSKGYIRVDLDTKGTDGKQHRHTKTLHCLVAEAFLGTPNKGIQVHHKDGIRDHNSMDNLEYLTPQEHRKKHLEMERKANERYKKTESA